MSHRNARLTFHGRRLLVARVECRDAGRSCREGDGHLAAVRPPLGGPVSRRGRGWPARPVLAPARLPEPDRAEVEAGGAAGAPWPSVAGRTGSAPSSGVPARTVSRILRRHQVPYLRECDPLTGEVIRASKTTAVRYERDRPGELVHMDVKKIGRIPDGGGWRAHGRQMGSSAAARRRPGSATTTCTRWSTTTPGWPTPRSCPTRRAPPAPAFLRRAAAYFADARHPRIERVHHRQPLQLPTQQRRRRSHRRPRRQTQVHPTALPVAERQGREVQPHPAGRVGLPAGLPHQRRPLRRPCALARALQHSTPPHRTRRTPADQPTVTNLMAEYTSHPG